LVPPRQEVRRWRPLAKHVFRVPPKAIASQMVNGFKKSGLEECEQDKGGFSGTTDKPLTKRKRFKSHCKIIYRNTQKNLCVIDSWVVQSSFLCPKGPFMLNCRAFWWVSIRIICNDNFLNNSLLFWGMREAPFPVCRITIRYNYSAKCKRIPRLAKHLKW